MDLERPWETWAEAKRRIRTVTYRAWCLSPEEPHPRIEQLLHEFFLEYGPRHLYPRSLSNMYPIHVQRIELGAAPRQQANGSCARLVDWGRRFGRVEEK